MERLQAALEKARAERGGQTPRPSAGPRPGLTAQASSAWEALRPLEIEPARLYRHRIIAAAGGKDATLFDLLRTRILQQFKANSWRRLAITSPGSGCGKTTVTLNLAMSLARQTELKTMVFEMDMRRPTLARVLGHRGSESLWQVFDGSVAFADQAVRFGDNVALALNHQTARNPSELLGSTQTADCLAEIERAFRPDIVLFDMPPMLMTDDNIAFADNMDAVMLIAAAGTTTVKQIDVCERDLAAHTNFLGVVLNKCRFTDGTYGYDYKYE